MHNTEITDVRVTSCAGFSPPFLTGVRAGPLLKREEKENGEEGKRRGIRGGDSTIIFTCQNALKLTSREVLSSPFRL